MARKESEMKEKWIRKRKKMAGKEDIMTFPYYGCKRASASIKYLSIIHCLLLSYQTIFSSRPNCLFFFFLFFQSNQILESLKFTLALQVFLVFFFSFLLPAFSNLSLFNCTSFSPEIIITHININQKFLHQLLCYGTANFLKKETQLTFFSFKGKKRKVLQ